MRQVQSLRCSAKAQLFSNGNEITEMTQLHIGNDIRFKDHCNFVRKASGRVARSGLEFLSLAASGFCRKSRLYFGIPSKKAREMLTDLLTELFCDFLLD